MLPKLPGGTLFAVYSSILFTEEYKSRNQYNVEWFIKLYSIVQYGAQLSAKT